MSGSPLGDAIARELAEHPHRSLTSRQIGPLYRILPVLDDSELEFLVDAFIAVGEDVPGYPIHFDVEAFNRAAEVQDEIEIRKYGRIITPRIHQ